MNPHQPNQTNQPNQSNRKPQGDRNRNQSEGRPGGSSQPNQANRSNRSGRPNQSGGGQRSGGRPGGRPGQGQGRRNSSAGRPSRGKRPSMAGLMQTVAKTVSGKADRKDDPIAQQAHQPSIRQTAAKPQPGGSNDMAQLDNRDSGMLYPGGEFQEKPHNVRGIQSKLRIIPLGGLGEIGMNCTALEYGNDIVIIDVGFMFPDETMPGVDYVIPDVSYLEKKKQNIRGVLITHAHLDHIGGAPYIIPKLGFPDIYATQLTEALMKSNMEEHKLGDRVKFKRVQYADRLRLGVFGIEFFHINHNIPEGMGMAVTTPVGVVTHSGDFKFDHTPISDTPAEFDKIKAIGDRGVLLAMNDSTNVEKPGHTVSEAEIGQALTEQIGKAKGRVIMSTFASLIARLQEAIDAAQQNKRKVTIVGRSMLKNIEICNQLGYLKIPKDILIDPRDLRKYRDNELLIICTGSQATEYSALLRMSVGEHKQVKIKQGDTVILSSSPVPGNERAVGGMMDDLFRQGADVIYSKLYDIHTSGHAYQDELKEMLRMLKPKHFMPIHGEYSKRVLHGRLAVSEGIDPANVHLIDNGQVLEANHAGTVGLTKEKAGGGLVFVDGLGVGDIGQVVLRDRKHMAEDGMFVIIVTVERKSGRLVGSPDILSRGFIYLRESGHLLDDVRAQVKKKFGGIKNKPGDWNFIKNKIRDDIGDYLFDKTQRRPMVLPVVIEV